MANNKVVLGNETLIDLTEDTATVESVLDGYTFHGADGVQRVGTAIAGGGDDKMNIDGSNADSAVTFANSAFTIGSRVPYYEIGTESHVDTVSVDDWSINRDNINNAILYNNLLYIVSDWWIDALNPETNTFTTCPQLPYNFAYNRFYGASVVYHDRIHIIGGYGSSSFNNHYSWGIGDLSWTKECSLPYGTGFNNLCRSAFVVFNDRIYLFGGIGSNGSDYNNYMLTWKEGESSWSYNNNYPYQCYGGRAVVYDNKIHVLGGNNSSVKKYHYSWNGEFSSGWTKESNLPVNFGYSDTSFVYDNKIYILSNIGCYYYDGGQNWISDGTLPISVTNGTASPFNNIVYAFGTNRKWSCKIDNTAWVGKSNYVLPMSSNNHRDIVIYNNKAHLLGISGSIDSHYSCDLSTYELIKESTMPYNSRGCGVVVYQNKIHMLGGPNSNTYKNHYSWDGTSWVQESILPYNFYMGCVIIHNNKIHILGSDFGSDTYTLHYSWDGTSWTQESTLPYELHYGAAVSCNNKIYILGGENDRTYGSRKFYSWDGSSWTQEINLPYGLYSGVAVTYENKVHVSGFAESNYISYHYVYDPSSKIWSRLDDLSDLRWGSMVIYNNKIYTFKYDDGFVKTWYIEHIIKDVSVPKIKTHTQGDRLIANGEYSYSRGSDNVVDADYSSIVGYNGKVVEDFSYIFAGPTAKQIGKTVDRFAFGFSVNNNIIASDNSYGTAIDMEYGYSGLIVNNSTSSAQVNAYGKNVRLTGIYILFAAIYYDANSTIGSSPNSSYFCVCMISGGQVLRIAPSSVTNGSPTCSYQSNGEYLIISSGYINSYQSKTQFTLIRLI